MELGHMIWIYRISY